ncbi:MAG: hypothetical protein QG635_1895, partial [Bacteroidota bacterium]|nr:hypothetical protein [Bacteroidota bacterium]
MTYIYKTGFYNAVSYYRTLCYIECSERFCNFIDKFPCFAINVIFLFEVLKSYLPIFYKRVNFFNSTLVRGLKCAIFLLYIIIFFIVFFYNQAKRRCSVAQNYNAISSFFFHKTLFWQSVISLLFLIIHISILLFNPIEIQAQTDKRPKVKLGIDVLEETNFRRLHGKKVALLTNNTGRDSKGELSAEILSKTDKLKLTAIFVPEHGFHTTIPAGDNVDDSDMFGIPIISLYGKNKAPGKEIMDLCDAVVVDLQEIGCRSYTYCSTLFYVMKSCAEYGKEIIVLDRPNPLGGKIVDGNIVEKGRESYVGIIPTAYLHGCTIGELAAMIAGEGWMGVKKKCKLAIVKMQGWHRSMTWIETGLTWIPTSPHIPSPEAAMGYATIGIFGELGIFSIGIGTTLPFQYLGSPDLDIDAIYKEFEKIKTKGMKLFPVKYRPFYGLYSGRDCSGFLLKFDYGAKSEPYTAGVSLALAIRKVHPFLFNKKNIADNSINMFKKVTGSAALFDALTQSADDEPALAA